MTCSNENDVGLASKRWANDLLALDLDRTSELPLWRQLADEIREAIRRERVIAGTRLPASRALAKSLSVSRNTVLSAMDQLTSEGYLVAIPGSGVIVSSELKFNAEPENTAKLPIRPLVLSLIGQALAAIPSSQALPLTVARAFRPNCPAIDLFPIDQWIRMQTQLIRNLSRAEKRSLFWEGDPYGYGPLREEIARLIGLARNVRCSPNQIIITAGAQQGISLATQVLLAPGDACWIEDPCYISARLAIASSGATLVPVPVDEEGMDVAWGEEVAPKARLAYVTPSKQFPLGMTLSLRRRKRLIDWANRMGAYILEDDYDSEFQYGGRQLSALQGLDDGGRVFYIGTFSKTIFPSLRLGYIVVPPNLIDVFGSARAVMDRHSHTIDQAVLAEFMVSGQFARHLGRMRKVYGKRLDTLLELAKPLATEMTISPSPAGLQLIASLAPGLNADVVSKTAYTEGVDVVPLNRFSINRRLPEGLLLGFAGYDSAEMRVGMAGLVKAFKASRS